MHTKSIMELYETFNKGDALTGEELCRLSAHMRETATRCAMLGERFVFQANEAYRVAAQCESFLRARETSQHLAKLSKLRFAS